VQDNNVKLYEIIHICEVFDFVRITFLWFLSLIFIMHFFSVFLLSEHKYVFLSKTIFHKNKAPTNVELDLNFQLIIWYKWWAKLCLAKPNLEPDPNMILIWKHLKRCIIARSTTFVSKVFLSNWFLRTGSRFFW